MRFETVYAVSANTRRFWDTDAGAAWGYVPVDDAEAFASGLPQAKMRVVGRGGPVLDLVVEPGRRFVRRPGVLVRLPVDQGRNAPDDQGL
ncbi:hypothetical protein [Streptomyces profundus]|uniref:hypothetical protein n=1 Tax=Streptomyces profundus TaxID=2867410 RepID=UPI001D16BACA|nr:hypothetical protein [Streptomyces sp. MA3_2.13]